MAKKGRISPPKLNADSQLGIKLKPQTKDPNQEYPKFSFQYLQQGFCISDCTKEEKSLLLDSIHKRSQLTWQQLHNAGRHKLGSENIPRNQIRAPIPDPFKDEESFMVFRGIEKAPVVGVRLKTTFYVLWVDRAFSLYKH